MKVKGIQQTINGIKIEFNDFIKPIDRKIIFQKLEELQNQKDLSAIEQKELQFFIAGFLGEIILRSQRSNKRYNIRTQTLSK